MRRFRLTARERKAVEKAAALVGNKAADGERTVDAYLRRQFPRHDLWRRCYLLREAAREARRQGLVDVQGKRPGAR